jgi:hypothetical protein
MQYYVIPDSIMVALRYLISNKNNVFTGQKLTRENEFNGILHESDTRKTALVPMSQYIPYLY